MSVRTTNWIYKHEELVDSDIPEWAMGFVYVIYSDVAKDEETGNYYAKPYVGKKFLKSTRKTKIGVRAQKKQLEEVQDKRRVKKVQTVVKDSNWKDYWGSCKELLEDIKIHGKDRFTRIILEFAHSKKHLSYLEVKHQILEQCLETITYNDNMLGKWFRKDLIRPKNELDK